MKLQNIVYPLFPTIFYSSENYHPTHCDIQKYKFAFLKHEDQYMVHGLWPDLCSECKECGYPTCCNVEKILPFTMPTNTTFIDSHWYGGTHPTKKIETCGEVVTTLFEHEIIKHSSCMGLHSTDYMELVEKLYHTNVDHINKYCSQKGKSECEIDLDQHMNIV